MYFVNRYSLTPMITLLVRTRHGVIDDFYFFGHRWSHYFILLSATTLCKITGYDLQLLLKYRNNIWNKKTKIQYCLCTKIFLRLPHPRRPRGVSRVGRKGGTKVFRYGQKSPWVPTLTELCPKIQADAGSWLGTKNALYYCAQSANSFSWVLFVSSYTTAIARFVHQACASKGNFYFLLS